MQKTEIFTKRMTHGGFVYHGVNALQAKITFIERLYELNVNDANEIDWEDLAGAIGDVPPPFVQAKFYKLKAACVPFWQKKTFPGQYTNPCLVKSLVLSQCGDPSNTEAEASGSLGV